MPTSEILLKIYTDTKEEENEIIEQFLTRLQYKPSSLKPIESPDFEVEINEKLIGIEITKFYSDFTSKGSLMQQKLIEWKKFASNLKLTLTAVDSEFQYFYGAVHFQKKRINYKLLLQEEYVNEIVSCIKSANVQIGQQQTIKLQKDKFPLLFEFIESIYFWNTYPESKYLWWDGSLQSGEVVENGSALQLIVNKKEEAAIKYSRNFSQKWLIIYAAGLGLADIFTGFNNTAKRQGKIFMTEGWKEDLQLNEPTVNSDYFTHIFIWDKFHERIFKIFPYFKKIFDYGELKLWINHLPICDQKM